MEKSKIKKEKTFELQMMDVGRIPNLTAAAIACVYMFYFADFPIAEMGWAKVAELIGVVVICTIIAQFGIAPRTNHLLTKNISEELERDKTEPLNVKERTRLVNKLMSSPKKIAIQVFLVFLGIAAVITTMLKILFDFESISIAFFFVGTCYGAYNAGILAFAYAENFCSTKAQSLIARGLENNVIHRDKFYGMPIPKRVVYFILLPTLAANTVQAMYLYTGYMRDVESTKLIVNMILIVSLNSLLIIGLSAFLYNTLIGPTKKINSTLESLTEGKLSEKVFLPSDLRNEIAYNLFIVNEIISYLQTISADEEKSGENIIKSTSELSDIARLNAENSLKQASSVRECLATMENVKHQLKEIAENTLKVSKTADATADNVNLGFDLLNKNIAKMSEISDANIETISGIKTLSEKVEDVWNSINTIDAITEKTRIIAFNAELEATSAGEKGENFHIVANEIRRLAATVTESIREIKDGIKKIQESSDNLIITSEGGTQKIREGSEFFTELEEHFTDLHTTSDVTSESAQIIQTITANQDSSFVQINSTLHQISTGFDQFSQSAQLIKQASEKLKDVSSQLNIKKQEVLS